MIFPSLLSKPNSLPLKKVNDEVFFATAEIVRFDSHYVDFVKRSASANPRGRARVCAHRGPKDALHEMLIALRCDSYIRPHRHHLKAESFHLVEGMVDVVVFGNDGSIFDVIELSKEGNFYYRLDSPRYHTLLIHSTMLVIHEITNGPFDADGSDWAPFAPIEGTFGADQYLEELRQSTRNWKLSQ
jgi:cupin fold WbuC family metalloprotein